MRLKALTSFSLGGGNDVHAGDVFDMENKARATGLVYTGMAEPAKEPEASPDAPSPEAAPPTEPAVTHPERGSGYEKIVSRDPKPAGGQKENKA
jgi:hypothetical protein